MGEDTREVREQVGAREQVESREQVEARAQVEAAREQLGDTVAALVYKANAPRRAKERAAIKLEEAKRRVNGILRNGNLR